VVDNAIVEPEQPMSHLHVQRGGGNGLCARQPIAQVMANLDRHTRRWVRQDNTIEATNY
jgi:hypothetical protein